MGRVRPLFWGLVSGVGAYGGMHVYTTSQLERTEVSLRGLRHAINPAAPAPAADAASWNGSVLHRYRAVASDSFKSNWNETLHKLYNGFVSTLNSAKASVEANTAPKPVIVVEKSEDK
mmetsp:Transcript_18716/g.34670  ORF Transcript_18716/g.34670 Transcript_18716/m.34670 type:complete len:118 (+) Transcript_18716:71-424(+)|eukprot:CAMPEP_0184517394 /NCGR_PEP_ID=MMETSP0198_2-20121128/5536_1 /TAXON_ID=1112570 /ORGANISM="Thraustochytrium sp., Strain LLF1b" /LENGTH=117 /DNA_ID=CAMNT_0026907773 /DNA_START=71 /DNA_END=424 /DNA_ORIENTATION=+